MKNHPDEELKVNRQRMIELLNEDLAREYQAIIAYVVYSQTLTGAAYSEIAKELQIHAGEELSHALKIANQIDYLGGTPTTVSEIVKVSKDPEEMLRFDLENERVTIINYRRRIRQAEAMGEYALGEVLRQIIAQEQDHLIDLANALGIEAPHVGD
jgi:bacterioferritin